MTLIYYLLSLSNRDPRGLCICCISHIDACRSITIGNTGVPANSFKAYKISQIPLGWFVNNQRPLLLYSAVTISFPIVISRLVSDRLLHIHVQLTFDFSGGGSLRLK